MILEIVNFPILVLQSVLSHVIKYTVIFSLLYGLLHRLGIVQRLLQRHVELELSKISNGAQITISSIEFNLSPFNVKSFFTTSTISATEIIIHTPKQNEWKWDSPLIARIGKLDVSFNLFTIIEIPQFIQETIMNQFNHVISTTSNSSSSSLTMKSSIKDIYTLQAYDVQVFIEKRGNVFNFHLLDPRLDLPKANEVLESIGYNNNNNNQQHFTDDNTSTMDSRNGSIDSDDVHFHHQQRRRLDSSISPAISKSKDEFDTSNNDIAESKANEIVKSIVNVVSSLGNAVMEGEQSGLSVALKNQKDGFVKELRKVQDLVGVKVSDKPSNVGNESHSTKGNRTTVIAKESIQVIKQVGKVMEKNVLTMKEKVISLSKPPPIKEGFKNPENPDLFRVGYVELRDVRIFTKEIISRGSSGGATKNVGNTITSTDQDSNDGTNSNDLEFKKPMNNRMLIQQRHQLQNLTHGVNNWSKPILVKELKLFHSELCPSSYSIAALMKEKPVNHKQFQLSSSSSSFDTAFLIGLPIEQVINILITRILTEVAKTNTGQLLTNAFSEVFAWFDVEA